MHLQTVLDILKEFLDDNLSDVYTSRDTEWIYIDKARANLALNMFPRILIDVIDVPNARLAVGSTQSIDTAKLRIMVKCLVGNKYTYNNAEYTGEQLAVILIEEIDNLIKANHPYFITKGLQYVFPVGGPMKEFDTNKNITGILQIEAQYIN